MGATVLCAAAIVWTAALCFFDITRRRLPDILTLPAAAVALGVCAVYPVGLYGLVWPAGYSLLGRGIGGGDIKLALPLGVGVAVAGGGVFAVLCAVLLASVFTLLALLIRGEERVAHGPSMLTAAWIAGLAL